jgi:hypothetical protein
MAGSLPLDCRFLTVPGGLVAGQPVSSCLSRGGLRWVSDLLLHGDDVAAVRRFFHLTDPMMSIGELNLISLQRNPLSAPSCDKLGRVRSQHVLPMQNYLFAARPATQIIKNNLILWNHEVETATTSASLQKTGRDR